MDRNRAQQWRRRKLLFGFAGVSALAVSGTARAVLNSTPGQSEGPFYPRSRDRFKDIDNDLVKVESRVREAGGEILHLSGVVRTISGELLVGARVELWQCDINGRYIHSRDRNANNDPDFQGFGHSVTDAVGRYGFRTIRPVPYTGRTPHIHFKVLDPSGNILLTTQMYVEGEPDNERDGLYRRMSRAQQKLLTVSLRPKDDGEYAGVFDIAV